MGQVPWLGRGSCIWGAAGGGRFLHPQHEECDRKWRWVACRDVSGLSWEGWQGKGIGALGVPHAS